MRLLDDLSLGGPRVDIHSTLEPPLGRDSEWLSIEAPPGKPVDLQDKLQNIEAATVIVCRDVFSAHSSPSSLGQIRCSLVSGGAAVIVERTADRFREYLSVWRRLIGTAPITSEAIQKALLAAGYALRSIQVRNETWLFSTGSTLFQPGSSDYMSALPPDMRTALASSSDDGIVGSVACVIAEARIIPDLSFRPWPARW